MSFPNASGNPVHNLGSVVYQTAVELPYRALTIPRQYPLPNANGTAKEMSPQNPKSPKSPTSPKSLKNGGQFTGPISDEFLKLYNAPESVSSVLAQDPTISPEEAWKKLYGHHAGKPKGPHSIHEAGKHTPSDEEGLQKAAECGHWGPTQPSKLFLQMYHDAINSLEENPAHGVVSPSLMGSCGVLPLTIISTLAYMHGIHTLHTP